MKIISDNSDYSLSVALMPLVDIIFLLVIFFLASSTFQKDDEKDIKIDLPSAKGKASSAEEKKEVVSWKVSIEKDETIYIDGKSMDFAQIEKHLEKNQDKNDKIQITMRADKMVSYGIVIQVLGLMNEYGYKKIAFKSKVLVDKTPKEAEE